MKRHTAIAEVFMDYGQSGSTAERPGIYELLGTLNQDQTIGYVIAADPARIARMRSVADWIEQRIADAGCVLVYADGNQPLVLAEREHTA